MAFLLRQSTKCLRNSLNFQPAFQQWRWLSVTGARSQDDGKNLFTPGPLNTHADTREAMQKDFGSRDKEFIECIEFIRTSLVAFAHLPDDKFTCIPMQGAGTMGVESTIGTTVPRDGKILICSNGAYGDRIGAISKVLGINSVIHKDIETEPTNLRKVEEILANDKAITNVAMVHCETTTGIFNPIEDVGQLVRKHAPNAAFFVDAMSSFAAVPINFEKAGIDFLVSSANKCTEGVPGFSFILANVEKLEKCEGNARSLSLDALAQYKGFRENGQFRFTPPTHVLMAFKRAIELQKEEGGVEGRSKRYQENRKILKSGMKEMGFRELLKESDQGYIITSFYYPDHPNFRFEDFYTRLSEKGQVIYPGKVSQASCFRIGNIGQLYADDMKVLLKCVRDVCSDMNIPLPLA
ncbi:uncharacterized protein LOC114520017 [Dendronephthya gigantea]|uniref:uncharacterized protein LOC114520017 n=1 Tax=Dendronephthya gigantea TaxID=151771 RepID=UPI001069E773|nr:uncharacterized protein LOC114520017 [Dendronephthya gigantea]